VGVKLGEAQACRLPHRCAALQRQPWQMRDDPMVGVAVHEPDLPAPNS
jgi:hypothetical protein